MRNVELLERTMQFINEHPEKHDQTNYCGTKQCFAGWAVALEGWRVVDYAPAIVERDGMYESVPALAQYLLGLTNEEAFTLFLGFHSRADLELMVKDLVNGDELRDPEDYRLHHEGP